MCVFYEIFDMYLLVAMVVIVPRHTKLTEITWPDLVKDCFHATIFLSIIDAIAKLVSLEITFTFIGPGTQNSVSLLFQDVPQGLLHVPPRWRDPGTGGPLPSDSVLASDGG